MRDRFSFYDSLILVAALESGCAWLLREDLQHGQIIEGLTIVNPFAPCIELQPGFRDSQTLSDFAKNHFVWISHEDYD